MKPLHAIIVDDEALGRALIREMLRDDPEVTVMAECANGHQALESISADPPDLLFLDVQMPEIDGFELLAALRPQPLPLVIFVTAYDQYAVRAFEVHALDYLLKPFDRERFTMALGRAKAIHAHRQHDAVNERILALLEEQRAQAKHLDRLVVKDGGRIFFLKVDEIDWIEAEGNYVRLHVKKDSYWLRETISHLESQLDPRRFARIHRSQIVNIDRIRELQPWSHGEYRVLLADGAELSLSRSHRERLHELLGKTL